VDVLSTLFLLLFVLILSAIAVPFVVVAIGHRQFTRANRISPKVASQAPLLWRWSFAAAARQHRRLQRIAALARTSAAAAGVGGVGVADLASDIERQACAIDDQLALTRHLPTHHRVRRIFELERAIADLEQLALRITILAGQVSSPMPDSVVPLAERIGHLETAVAEVKRIEAEALGEARSIGLTELPLPQRDREQVRRKG
jgi:hypothetical protein